jgi:hypothetical protein
VAPDYPCGAPAIDAAVDTGVFIWRDCPSGEWRLKTAAAAGNVTYTGTVTSSAPYLSVAPVGLSSFDLLDSTSNPNQISFTFHTNGTSTDGFKFTAQYNSSNCLSMSVPSTVKVYFGPFRAPMGQDFTLETQSTCP